MVNNQISNMKIIKFDIRLVLTVSFLSILYAAGAATLKVSERDTIVRKKILLASFPRRKVSQVDIREIDFKPLQQTGYHLHPIPVTGYIVSGTVTFQVEGEPVKTLHAGDAFYEPANHPISHFDNASSTERLKFVAFYLTDDDKALIQMLAPKTTKTFTN